MRLKEKQEKESLRNLFCLVVTTSCSCSVSIVEVRGSLAGGSQRSDPGIVVGRIKTDHSACSIAVSRLALPAVSICQPRSAKRCVSVEGQGPAKTTNQMTGGSNINRLSLPVQKVVAGPMMYHIYLTLLHCGLRTEVAVPNLG